MAAERIVIVEDDRNISRLLRYNLEKEGYACSLASNAGEALEALSREKASLIILDIMLPGGVDGFELCRRIKREQSLKDIPVIMLTARGEEVDRVVGLELGADDYVVKPFSPRELTLRVKAVLRRQSAPEQGRDIFSCGGLYVNLPEHKAEVNGKNVELTLMEFKLLAVLVARKGRVQTRDKLLSEVWDMHADVYTRTVDTHIKRLREKLGPAGRMIETVRGVGYRFNSAYED
ncbi:MAG: response regulator transcription factor [Candidatus Omnitrophota bacterium]|jgi:two-component system OmpR family response regulator|nr:response regulator transcription factor [Candidatus Omnitrophota bacterium]